MAALLAAPAAAILAQAPTAATSAALKGSAVALTRVVFDLPRGERYEVEQAGLLCVTQRTLVAKGEAVPYEAAPYRRAFRTAMLGAGVAAEGDPTQLFEAQVSPSDLSVGALVTGLHARACVNKGCASALTRVQGEAHMAVEWQVFSRSAHAVVTTVRTQADVALRAPVAGDAAQVTAAALGANAALLARDDGFRQALAAASAP